MDTELDIIFRNMDKSEALENMIREKAAKMEQFFPHIIDARVICEMPHWSQVHAQDFHMTIEVNVPGNKLVVSRDPGKEERHKHAEGVVKDSFEAMYKQLKSESRKMSGDVKSHELPPQGIVIRKFPEQDYGFIRMNDGRELYFHRNAVVNPDFDELEIDQPVRVDYVQNESPQGPQATTIEAISSMKYVEGQPIGNKHMAAS
jgi:cold shock CspA family protein/ribosome-associated translation inhibitor RaiA